LIQAVVFDFDGLVVDSESCLYEAWLEVYREHDLDLPVEHLTAVVGSATNFDPVLHLTGLLGPDHGLDEAFTKDRIRDRFRQLVEAKPVLPGVVARIEEADRLGWPRGVASSSTRAWVTGHLDRLGLGGWTAIRCRDDAPRAKPFPDLYELVMSDLGLPPPVGLALEDSPNGIRAAKAAGMWCVAVPGGLTADLDVSEADLKLASLAQMTLEEMAGRLG